MIFALTGVDRISKILVVRHMEYLEKIPLVPGVFQLFHTRNEGAAFGILQNHRWIFMSVTAVFIVVAIVFLMTGRIKNKLFTFSMLLIISGGIGNMIDRVRLGYVVDFFDFCLIKFAIFNVADSFISVGAVLLAVYMLFFLPPSKKTGGEEIEHNG